MLEYGTDGQYRVTPADRLWLLRAVAREGEPRARVAQTLVNRFVWLRSRGSSAYKTLADLVRAYAQPVNPRWFVAGDLYRAFVEANPDHWMAAKSRALRREVYSRATSFTQDVRAAVARALGVGSADINPSTVHYLSSQGTARDIERRPTLTITHEGARGERNVFYAHGRSEGWRGYSALEGPALKLWQVLAALAALGTGLALSRRGT